MTVPPEPPAAPPPPPVPYPYPAPVVARHTNGFAIASLVCSLATFVACGIGSILGIVFGHIARSQIKRTGEDGAGMALAGLIIGYVCLGLAVAVIGSIIVLTAVVDHASAGVDYARSVDREIVRIARFRGTPPRDRSTILQAFGSTCCGGGVTLGSTMIPFFGASGHAARGVTNDDLARVGWRLDISGPFDRHACLTVPSEPVTHVSDVSSGRC